MHDEQKKCEDCGRAYAMLDPIEKKVTTAKPGDITLCVYCGLLSKFTSDLKLVRITPEDLVVMNDYDPDFFDGVIKLRHAIKMYKR